MSVTGIASSILSDLSSTQNHQSRFQQIPNEFQKLAQDLQSGNLQGAQQDFMTLQQDLQQSGAQSGGHVGGHRHHHHAESSQESSSIHQNNPIVQAFSTLAQDLQAGNLSGAQSAFATLQNDLQQIGGFVTAAGTSTAAPASAGSLNVSA